MDGHAIESLLAPIVDGKIVSIKKLVGYDNANYLLRLDEGLLIFKTYLYDPDLYDVVVAEIDALLHLQGKLDIQLPCPVTFTDGSYIKNIKIASNKVLFCRMLTFVEGTFMGDVATDILMAKNLGNAIGQLHTAFSTYHHTLIKSRRWEWNLEDISRFYDYLPIIKDIQKRKLVHYFLQQCGTHFSSHLPVLPKSYLHNDINEWNIIIKGHQIDGFIDFGDIAYGARINDICVASLYIAYRYDIKDAVQLIMSLVMQYHQLHPLSELEVEALYYGIAARAVMSIANASYAAQHQEDNEYANISQTFVWNFLQYWHTYSPIEFANLMKDFLGIKKMHIPSPEKVIDGRKKHFGKTLSLSYTNPIYLSHASYQYMYDQYGNTILDAYNNIPQVGHSHPRVTEAAHRQMTKLNTNTRYYYDAMYDYADHLLSHFEDSLTKLTLVNSGSAASDLAIRMSWANHGGGGCIVVLEHGYHGNTNIGIDISDYKFSQPKGFGQKSFIIKAPIPDTYRGKYKGEDAGERYADDLISYLKSIDLPIVAFIAEPIVGCGGQVPLPKGYLPKVYNYIRSLGGYCISDEVQTGFGRLGAWYWGYQMYDVVPDMVILGKPMGNGHPVGGVVCTAAVMDEFDKGVEFFSSFGGNPVSCEVGNVVLQIIEDEGLQDNALEVGKYYKECLAQLALKYSCIGDVRGEGLFLGVDIVIPGSTMPNTQLAAAIKNELRDQLVLVSTDGPADNVIKTKPPLCFSRVNVDRVIEVLDDALRLNTLDDL